MPFSSSLSESLRPWSLNDHPRLSSYYLASRSSWLFLTSQGPEFLNSLCSFPDDNNFIDSQTPLIVKQTMILCTTKGKKKPLLINHDLSSSTNAVTMLKKKKSASQSPWHAVLIIIWMANIYWGLTRCQALWIIPGESFHYYYYLFHTMEQWKQTEESHPAAWLYSPCSHPVGIYFSFAKPDCIFCSFHHPVTNTDGHL